MTFEELLGGVEPALQRFVAFRIGHRQDAELKNCRSNVSRRAVTGWFWIRR